MEARPTPLNIFPMALLMDGLDGVLHGKILPKSTSGSKSLYVILLLIDCSPATRAARTNEVMKVASLADAIRCDMAFLLLNTQFQQVCH